MSSLIYQSLYALNQAFYNHSIADDKIEQANQLAYILTQEKDLQVVNLSHDGNIALKHYLDLNPDVLILDLNMPGINAYRPTAKNFIHYIAHKL